MNRQKMVVFFLFSGLGLAHLLFSQAPTGRIVGIITDAEGTPLPGAAIFATSPSLIRGSRSLSDSSGHYRILALPPGNYKITFTLEGFKTVIRENIILSAEQTLSINIEMALGAIEEEVSVVGKSPLIDVKSTVKGMVLKKDVFNSLPRGRSFDSLVNLISGAVEENKYAGGTMIEGATGLENMYYVDGMDTTDLLLGNVQQDVAFEFVEEVQVKSGGYQAEYGGSTGGVVHVVTRSGGNEFHGEFLVYYEGSALSGKERDTLRLDPFDLTKAELVNYQDLYGKDKIDRWEVGFSLGGYTLKDRLWFFGSVLPVFRNTARTVQWLTGDIASSSIVEKYKWHNFAGKLTSQLTNGLRLSATFINNFSSYSGQLPDRDGSGDSTFPYARVGLDYPNWTGTLTADFTLGESVLLSVRGGYFETDTGNQKLKPTGVRYTFSETNAVYPDLVASYPEYIMPAGYENYLDSAGFETKKLFYSRGSANADITYYFDLGGEHAFKAGYQWVKLSSDLNDTYAYDYFGFAWGQDYYIFGQEDVVYKGKYGVYWVRFADSPGPDVGRFGKAASYRHAFYLQDSWTLANKLTINFGLRAEREDVPSYSDIAQYKGVVMRWDFFDKLAPRLGIVYDVFGNSSLKIFGNFAIYYDVLKLSLADGAYGAVRSRYNYYTLEDPQWWTYGNGYYPGTFINREDTYLPSHDYTDKNMRAMGQREFSIGVEKGLGENLSASVRFVRKSLLRAIDDIGIQTPGGTQWWIGNPGYGVTRTTKNGGMFPDIYPDTPKAKREYAAVGVTLDKRLADNWTAGVSYTWSRLWGNFSGLANTMGGQLYPNEISLYDSWYRAFTSDLSSLDGPLWTDRPHFFKLYGSYAFNFGATIGIISNARSGVPVSTRVISPGYWYPDGLMSNGRTSFIWTTDTYLEYNIRLGKNTLQLNLNVNNLFKAKTAQRKYEQINRIRIIASDEDKLTGTFDYRDYDYVADPRYLMEYEFYPPITARVGVKFIF